VTRGAADIGAGLAPARAARPIPAGQRIHVIGAAGAGAGAAALLALWAGAEVSGCDPGGPSPYSAAVEAAGIPMAWRHDPEHVRGLPHPERLAVTKALTAIDPDHPELAAARALGIPVEPWQQVVADAAAGRTLVAVAGTHGKSTSAGWLVHVLVAAGADPSAFVGALLPHSITGGLPATARRGAGPQVIVEADEYAGNFDAYRPNVALLTNLEWDHPDVFADRAAVIDSVERWIRRAEDEGTDTGAALIANVADPGVAELVSRLRDWPGELFATAMVEDPADDLAAASRAIAEEFRSGPTKSARLSRSQAWAGRRNPWTFAWRRPAATMPPMRSGSPRPPIDSASQRLRSPQAWPPSAASAAVLSGSARRPASWSTTTTGTIRRRSAKRSGHSGSASRIVACGPSTNR
jgi:hypothetical protein